MRDLNGKVLREYVQQDEDLDGQYDDWSRKRDYIYREGKLLASYELLVGPRHYHLDHLGTPRLISDSAPVSFGPGSGGNLVSRHDYYPFGEEIGEPTQEVMKFTGHERDFHQDPETNLDYMHARYCSPFLGRFLSWDPVESGDPKVPQSWNRYGYALNNPLKYVDPDGETARVFIDNQTTGVTRTTFSTAGVMQRVANDFRGADVTVAQGRASFGQRFLAVFRGDTIHQVTLRDSAPPTHARRLEKGVNLGKGQLRVWTSVHAPDNPETTMQEREVDLANTASHEVGHDLGLEGNANQPPDLMTEEERLRQEVVDLDFSSQDRERLPRRPKR